MPQYIVKVTDVDGWISPPIIAHFDDEAEAEKAVRLIAGDEVRVEVRGIRPDVMAVAFGAIPEKAVIFRSDWIWGGEENDHPEEF